MIVDILIIDDEADIRDLVAGILQDEGFKTAVASSTAEAQYLLQKHYPQLIILDIWLKESQMDGLQLLQIIKKQKPQIPILMMSGHGTIDMAVNATKMGAYGFLTKPFHADGLINMVKKALNEAKLNQEHIELLRNKIDNEVFFQGESLAIRQLNDQIFKSAQLNSRILIHGKHGSRQELVVRRIHELSARKDAAFITLHCANPQHVAAIFGNHQDIGLLERAHGGTLLCQEIPLLPLKQQQLLNEFMQSGKFYRTDSEQYISVDVRLIATASYPDNDDILNYCDADFITRIASHKIHAPDLWERINDCEFITKFEIEKYCAAHGLRSINLDNDALEYLRAYPWKGNFSELSNFLERLILANIGQENITLEDIKNNMQTQDYLPIWALNMNYKQAKEEFDSRYIKYIINIHQGNISKAADALNLDRATLHRKIKEYQG